MKKLKILSLFLALFLCLLSLSACSGFGDDAPGWMGDRDEDGRWTEVDFEEATLKVEVSANKDSASTFPAASIYTKGPDEGTSTDEVQKKVLIRNEAVRKELNIDVVYRASDVEATDVYKHVEKYVLGSSDDAPDVLDNDIYGLVRAMMGGMLWNVSNPGLDAAGNGIYSYFDFSREGWYTAFMQGASFDSQKLYLLAGDYHIDLLRYAWVFFTNISLFDATFATTDYKSYDFLVEYITATNDFLYDDLAQLAKIGFRDTGKHRNETDAEDQIGVLLNGSSAAIFLASSGLSIIEWVADGAGGSTPRVYEVNSSGANALARLSLLYSDLYRTRGVRYVSGLSSAVTDFFDGNVILTVAKLGEMESAAMRELSFNRGILPFPRYERGEGSDFVTTVDDRAEVSCILATARSFSLASAYMQYLNEESDEVLYEYFERSLKFKYNESRAVREMIDFIKSKIRSPFDYVMTTYLCESSAVGRTVASLFQSDAAAGKISFTSNYAKNQSSYQVALRQILEVLAGQD